MKKTLALIICLSLLALSIGCAAAGRAPSGESPKDVSKMAVENIVSTIQQVFGEEMDLSEFSYAKGDEDSDFVYAGKKERPSYYGYTDPDTGAVQHISKNYSAANLTEEQREEAGGYAAMLMAGDLGQGATRNEVNETIVNACTPVAIELIERTFANGRTVKETRTGFVMTDSVLDPCFTTGILLRMSKGECYTVTVLWPQLEVVEVSFYPKGWRSCLRG